MKIYTRTGDSGETSLFGGSRVAKNDLRIEAYGTIDELNSFIGVARASWPSSPIDSQLQRVQADLFDIGAYLAAPDSGSFQERAGVAHRRPRTRNRPHGSGAHTAEDVHSSGRVTRGITSSRRANSLPPRRAHRRRAGRHFDDPRLSQPARRLSVRRGAFREQAPRCSRYAMARPLIGLRSPSRIS